MTFTVDREFIVKSLTLFGSIPSRPAVEADAPVDSSAKVGQKRKATSKTGGKQKKAKVTCSDAPNPLDMTAIHPESYPVANRWGQFKKNIVFYIISSLNFDISLDTQDM